jgi:hypothetical protein
MSEIIEGVELLYQAFRNCDSQLPSLSLSDRAIDILITTVHSQADAQFRELNSKMKGTATTVKY